MGNYDVMEGHAGKHQGQSGGRGRGEMRAFIVVSTARDRQDRVSGPKTE